MLENILCLQVFSLNVLKFDLYVLKQSIFRALKRDLERAYLMIVSKSSHFTSCFIDVVIYAQPSFASACEAWIPRHRLQTADILCIQVLFANCFQFWFSWSEKGHFASFIDRPLNEVRVKRVCKSCILEHSHERVPDHDRNLQKSDLRK